MADAYADEVMYSRDVTQLMRDINALEAEVAGSLQEPRMDKIAVGGGYAYVLSAEAGKVYKFDLSDWSLSTSWALTSLASTLGFSAIATNGTYIYVSTTKSATGDYETGSIHRYNTTGAEHATISVTDVAFMVCANDALYAVRLLPEEIIADVNTGVPYVEKRTVDGDLVWQTRMHLIQNGIGVDGSYVYTVRPLVFSSESSRLIESSGEIADPYTWSTQGTSGPWIHSDGTYTYTVARDLGGAIVTKRYANTGVYVSEHTYATGYLYDTKLHDGDIYLLTARFDSGSGTNTTDGDRVYLVDLSDMSISTANVLLTSDEFEQSQWYAYQDGYKTHLGTPDGGVSIPDLEALAEEDGAGQSAILAAEHILDMRAAVERLAPYYENSVTSNAFNWTDASEDNLYYVALGDRSEYGATAGAAYDWTRDYGTMTTPPTDYCYSIDIGEVYECVTKLQGSSLV